MRSQKNPLFNLRCFVLLLLAAPVAFGQTTKPAAPVEFGPYLYETKPDHEAFAGFNPRQAPPPGELLLQVDDRLAICGDSITEQKMYSRIMETYLTVCTPQLQITVRQYGWSGEKTDGFLRRMDQDCLTFVPTVATLAYGMNDARYRPFDVTNGHWYEDHCRAIVRNFKAHDVRVVVGSPGCSGKIAAWVNPRSGSLHEHNLNLCALRDIAIEVAESEGVRFADIFWPMYQAQVFAPGQHGSTEEKPYLVAGSDGIHPGWAGQVIMAWSMLRALGLDGEIAHLTVDMEKNTAQVSDGHTIHSFENGQLALTSTRYPFCAHGDINDFNSIRSGMTLVPFAEDLNRFLLRITNPQHEKYRVEWGDESREYDADALIRGVNLAAEFENNPFCDAFAAADKAVAEKQAFETKQVKEIFHGPQGKQDFADAVKTTEAQRKPLADAIAQAVVPVDHTIKIIPE